MPVRTHPYLVFFPLGIAIAWGGVGHWLTLGLGLTDGYASIFHSMAQIQGFLTAFAAGFVLTMLPRRTRTHPPSTATIAILALGIIGCPVGAWFEKWAVAQTFWLAGAIAFLVFTVRRLARPTRTPPSAFVWIPLALLTGIGGSVVAGVGGYLGENYWGLHQVGRGVVLQGMFLCFVFGVGTLVLPVMTGHKPPTDSHNLRRALAIRGSIALLLWGSFWLENSVSLSGGLILRGVLCLVVLLVEARIHRRPNKAGVNRWFIWIATWFIPAGYLLGGVLSHLYKAGMHVTFIGGFALLALAVGNQVVLGHQGYDDLKSRNPWPVVLFGVALILATVPRALMELRQAEFLTWITWAAGLFLLATLGWAGFLLPKLLRPRPSGPA